jgi:hypothetical protein
MILGMGARALGEHAQEKRQMEMAHDQMVFQMYQSHPQAAITKGGQEWLTKHGGKEVAEGFMQIGTLAHQAHQGFGQAFGGQPSSGPMSQGQGQPQPGASPQDPATEMKQRIGAMEQYMASDQWSQLSPEDQKLGTMLYNRHVQEYEKLTGQKAQSDRQLAGFQQQETLRKERTGDAEKLLHERIGAETGKEKEMIGLREGANIDEARKKKELGLTGAADRPAKPIPESVERGRRTLTVDRLNKEFDSLHPYASKNPFGGDYETKRDEFVKQRLGGVSPTDYVNASASAAAAVPSDVSNYADKYFPKK